MKDSSAAPYRGTILLLSCIIIALAIITTATGIFSRTGNGPYTYTSIRGEEITLYGKGIYRHMSEEVAVQGIGQDYITLFVVLPFLALSLYRTRKPGPSRQVILTGILFYLFVQYLFYMIMAMYSALFLLYVMLTGTTFFAFLLSFLSIDQRTLAHMVEKRYPRRFIGIFLLANTAAISLLWLSILVPPLLDGSIYPKEVEHYTTLIVQGMDLALLLPLAAVSAVAVLRKKTIGYLSASVYVVFLSLQMLALAAKIIAMGLSGYSIIPVIFIIPTILIFAVTGAVRMVRALKTDIPT